jgi:thiol-disulfide isomerase/thioredoxin
VRHPARWIALGVGLVVVVLAVVLALNVGDDPQAPRQSALLGKAAPPLDLVDFDGNPVTSDSLAGKTVIVNFWNEWCIPCLRELPALKDFWEAHANDGDVVMLGIVHASDASTAKLARYAESEGLDWTLAKDPGNRAALDFAIRGQPETFAISPTGEITGFQYGEASAAGLEAMLARARGVA